jgi:hypothetical protein
VGRYARNCGRNVVVGRHKCKVNISGYGSREYLNDSWVSRKVGMASGDGVIQSMSGLIPWIYIPRDFGI